MTLLLVLALWFQVAPAQVPVCQAHDGLPDSSPTCTPGATDPRVTQDNIAQTICHRGYTATVRPPSSYTNRLKREQMVAYGLAGQALSAVEEDHLVALEIGGSPTDTANLWPELWTGQWGAHDKDLVENAGRQAVCRGMMPLAEAQQRMAFNWVWFGYDLGVLQ